VNSDKVELWLFARRPERPFPLAVHMTECVKRSAAEVAAAPTMADALGALGIATLKRVVQRKSSGERHALELLAADAFVTYAFEAAAEENVSVPPLVSHLLKEAV
jgi:hypothetical protein